MSVSASCGPGEVGLIPVRFTYDTKEVKTTAIVNKTHLTYHKGIGERK